MPISWRKQYEDGVRAASSGEHRRAVSLFTAIIDGGAPSWEPYFSRAWARLNAYSYDDAAEDAESDLNRALEWGGSVCTDVPALLGLILARRGDYKEAFPLLLQSVGRSLFTDQVERDLITSLASLLDTLESTGDPGEAVSICSKLELQVQAASLPSVLNAGILAEILATRSHCFEQLNENTKAQSDLIRVAQLAPAHPMASREAVKGGAKSPKAGGNRDPVFDDIGGWETPNTFQHQLKLIFESYFGNPDLEAVRQGFASYGRSPSRSFLLFGPSGCGKTYMIRAFAGEYYARHGVPLPMYTMRLNEIMEKWVGESEKTLTRIFKTAIQTQPSILFADEIDALGSSRETSQSWAVTQTAHFLQEIDRLQTEEAFVLFVGCTNRIWAVDSALMRRFEQLIPVELPDVKVRKAIFSAQLRRLHESKRPATLNLQALAEASHGLTPGDISNVIKRASELAQRDGGRALSDLDILTTLRSFQNPMHVRNWVHQSIAALRQAGHEDRANQVEEIYGPYVGDLHSDSGSSSSPGVNWRPVPENAWREELPYDISLIRSNRQ